MTEDAASRFDEWAEELDKQFHAYAARLLKIDQVPCSLEVIFHAANMQGQEPSILLRARTAQGKP